MMGIAAVSEIHIAAPLAIPIMARVVRNVGIASRVDRKPLTRPTQRPVASPADTPAKGPPHAIARAVVTDESPATAPTDRSISPAERTNVMATAMIAIIEVWRAM